MAGTQAERLGLDDPSELRLFGSLLSTAHVLARTGAAQGDPFPARLAAIAILACLRASAFRVLAFVQHSIPREHQRRAPNAIDRRAITDMELDDGEGDGEALGVGLGEGEALGKGIGEGCWPTMTFRRGDGALEFVGHAMSESMASETIATSRTNIKNLSM